MLDLVTVLFSVFCTRLYNPPCRSVRRSVTLCFLSVFLAFFALPLLPRCLVSHFYQCPCPSGRDFGSRVSGLVFSTRSILLCVSEIRDNCICIRIISMKRLVHKEDHCRRVSSVNNNILFPCQLRTSCSNTS